MRRGRLEHTLSGPSYQGPSGKRAVKVASIDSGTKEEGQTVGHLHTHGHRYTWTPPTHTHPHTPQSWTWVSGTQRNHQAPDIKMHTYPAVEGALLILDWECLEGRAGALWDDQRGETQIPRVLQKTPRGELRHTRGEADTPSLVLSTASQSGVSWLEGAGSKDPLEKPEKILGGRGYR